MRSKDTDWVEYTCPYCDGEHKRRATTEKIHPEECDTCHRDRVVFHYTQIPLSGDL